VLKVTGNVFKTITGIKANEPERTGVANDAMRSSQSGNVMNAADMSKSAVAAPHRSRYLGTQEKPGVCQMTASATNRQART